MEVLPVSLLPKGKIVRTFCLPLRLKDHQRGEKLPKSVESISFIAPVFRG